MGRCDAYLYFGLNKYSLRELAYTGYDLPLDLLSPRGSDSIVITFEVQLYARPYRGFSLLMFDADDAKCK